MSDTRDDLPPAFGGNLLRFAIPRPDGPSRGERPNVIVFFTDQQRWDTAGVHGNRSGLMPTFDRMAATATHVARSFTVQPVCGPSRACMQTGMYATRSGCYRNGVPLAVAVAAGPGRVHAGLQAGS